MMSTNRWGLSGGFELFLLPGKSNAKCTAILFNNNNKYAILHQHSDEDGNLLILEINAFNKYDFMLNIYGPKRNTSNFYCSTSDHLSAFNGEFLIMAGNFNLVQEPALDYFNYNNANNPESRKALLSLKE